MNYRMPAEWTEHDACWLAWPSHADLWGEDLPGVQKEFEDLCRGISYAPSGGRGENLCILVPDSRREAEARKALDGLPVKFFRISFGDIWLRDTGPIFVTKGNELASGCFRFNGWGGKYDLPHDGEVSRQIAEAVGAPIRPASWILEGGSVEVDGDGTCLTTEQCLLNTNRNPGLDRPEIERLLREGLGITKVLWLSEGLLNDHTDGHIDTLVRFFAPGKVVCMKATTDGDPNREVLDEIAQRLQGFRDAANRPLEVHVIPSPGKVTDPSGEILAASYANFYISNQSVVVPTYGVPMDDAAVKAVSRLFPTRKTFGLSAKTLLRGGGTFHCITQQQPKREGGSR